MDVDGAVGTERLLAQNDQPLRAGIGQGPEEDGIDECEDGRVCADFNIIAENRVANLRVTRRPRSMKSKITRECLKECALLNGQPAGSRDDPCTRLPSGLSTLQNSSAKGRNHVV